MAADTWSRKREGRNVRPLSLVVSVSRKTPVAKSITSRTRCGGVVTLENRKKVEAQGRVYCFEKKKKKRTFLLYIREKHHTHEILFFHAIKNSLTVRYIIS